MDIARGDILSVDAIVIDNLLTSYFQSLQYSNLFKKKRQQKSKNRKKFNN